MIFKNSPYRTRIIRRKRCRTLVADLMKEVRLTTVSECNICGSKSKTILSNEDRYGIPVRTAMCDQCGLVYLLDRPGRDGYETIYAKYYRPLVSAYWGRKVDNKHLVQHQAGFTDKLLRMFDGILDLQNAGTLLDIGGSTGMIAHKLASTYGLEATVLDPSDEELAVAREKGLKTVCGFIEDYQTSDTFDLILFLQTIDHVYDLKATLGHISQLLKEDGYFVIDTVNLPSVIADNTGVDQFFKIDHCYYFTPQFARAVLEASGFEIVSSDIATWPGHEMFICRKKGAFQADKTRVNTDIARLRFIEMVEHQFYLETTAKDKIIGILARLKRKLLR